MELWMWNSKNLFKWFLILPCWNTTLQKDHMKKSIKTDISLLNIYSLTNPSSSFFNGKSTLQNFFTCPYFSVTKKTSPQPGLGDRSACVGRGPPRNGHRQAGEPGRSHPLRHLRWCFAQPALGFGGSSSLTFPSRSLSVWYCSKGAESCGGWEAFVSELCLQYERIQPCNSPFLWSYSAQGSS